LFGLRPIEPYEIRRMKTSPGSTERFALPAVPANGSRSKPDGLQASGHDQASATRILIVEDDFLIAMQTEAALLEAGFEVGVATTAEQAVALARTGRPALAVMDIRLASKRDGIDAARELFNELDVRCIFATAHDDAATRERAEPYAPLGWLAKPYTTVSLVLLVNEAVSRLRTTPPT
jgi:two-component system, response regulator PdtaR